MKKEFHFFSYATNIMVRFMLNHPFKGYRFSTIDFFYVFLRRIRKNIVYN